MKIHVNLFDPSSIDNAIEQIDEFKRKLDRDMKYIVTEMAVRGVEIVRAEYAEAQYPGVKDYRVRYTYELSEDGHSAKVIAEGQSVLYLEFGAGLFKASAPFAVLDIAHGSVDAHGTHGQGKGKNPKGWVYVGSEGSNPPPDTYSVGNGKAVRTMGNDAVPAMWHAKKAMRTILQQILMEMQGS